MRSIIFALILAAPIGAVASTPTYGNPMTTMHRQKEKLVPLVFVNFTVQSREVEVEDVKYRVPVNSEMQLYVPVGSVVREYCDQNSKVNGQELMQVSAADAGRSVKLK